MSSGDLPVRPPQGLTVDPFACITCDLADKGWCVVDDFVSAEWAAELLEEQRLLSRGDALPAQQRYLTLHEKLRLAVNRDLYLGLCEQETHAAIYPPGGFYRRHLDGFQQGNLRTLSVILYLNPRWNIQDGGALRLYLDANPNGELLDVLPESGRLVAFLSECFHHEVLPTRRARLSITSWFTRRPLQ